MLFAFSMKYCASKLIILSIIFLSSFSAMKTDEKKICAFNKLSKEVKKLHKSLSKPQKKPFNENIFSLA